MRQWVPLARVLSVVAVVLACTTWIPETPETYVSGFLKHEDATPILLRDITGLVSTEGVSFAVEVVALAFKKNIIGNDHCHALLHLIGHQAYGEYGANLDALLGANKGRLCLGGYLHGVEAEIATRGENPKSELWSLCAAMKEAGVSNGPCFHGVGHSVFERTKDVDLALRYCESLSGGPERELWGCYRGVFSELGNALAGVDSNTGVSIEPIRIPNISHTKPYSYCDTRQELYQESCYTQLAKLFIDQTSLEKGLESCLKATTRVGGQAYCVSTVVGVWTRLSLDTGGEIPHLRAIETLPVALIESAFSGVKEGIIAHTDAGRAVERERVCGAFSTATLRRRCEALFS